MQCCAGGRDGFPDWLKDVCTCGGMQGWESQAA
jgi:hypothetical protein